MMFNGVIREIAKVVSFDKRILCLEAIYRPKLGDSIAVNGACLSVVELKKNGFSVELSSESTTKLALQNYKDKVHIEPAMRLGERIDGHLMQGHIDGVGEIYRIEKLQNGVNFYIKIPSIISHLISVKGSIAIDGVSLTVSEILGDTIRLTIIPLSLKDSLFGEFRVGRKVNIETDLLARYLDRIVSKKNSKAEDSLSWERAEFYANLY